MILASIITVYYNTPPELQRLGASLQKFLDRSSYEWIVMDNHSQQDLNGKVACNKYIRLPRNFGFSSACNLGAQESRAPNLFFLNPDCEIMNDCITPLANELERSAAAAGPQVLNPDGTIQLSFGPFLTIVQEAIQKYRTNHERSASVQKWLQQKTAARFEPDYVSGCALMIKADVFQKLGGFDEKFFLYEEDVDLCKRLKQAGHRLTYVPEAKVAHARNRSTRQNQQQSRAHYLKSQDHYYRKHHGGFQNFLLGLYRKFSKN